MILVKLTLFNIYKGILWNIVHISILLLTKPGVIAMSLWVQSGLLFKFSYALLGQTKERRKVWSLNHVPLFANPWTIAHQAPLSLEFSRQEHISGLLVPSTGDLPDPSKDQTQVSSTAGRFFTVRATLSPTAGSALHLPLGKDFSKGFSELQRLWGCQTVGVILWLFLISKDLCILLVL